MPALVPELYCADLKKSLHFYKNLGFRVKYQRAEESFAYLERGGAELMLEVPYKGRTWLKAPLEHPYGRGINLQIEVLDVDALHEKAQECGCEIFMDMEDKEYRCGSLFVRSRQFIVCDPDGYLLRFFQDMK